MTTLRRALFALLIVLSSSGVLAQTLALTFDDGLNPLKEPAAPSWNRQILETLHDAGVTSMVFPALVRTGQAQGLDLIRDWARAGHGIGNHTSQHRSLGSPQVPLADFISDVKEADAVLSRIPGWTKMLRFPYLKEGDTLAKRDGMRLWMQAAGYRAAPVSIDASDWYYNQAYAAWLDEGNADKANRVKAAYIEHLLDRAAYYDGLARQVLGRSPKHVMLLHTSRINAAALGELITAFRVRGWSFIAANTAFDDPIYTVQIDTLPAGESVVWASAKAVQVPSLRYPAEDSVYEEPKLRALGLVPTRMLE
ncbi:polysaccharide deacetylase family protein [Acidovorax cavernicola]|uniref:Polysaccharide deacetylase n=1 Tax=Acidovorax cavernicola TaxID=1675792 RepID=A0A9X8D7G0_9BURK|nr:polysaccharide deacetylase family protein [Acidovorax cavernicola]RIX83303.1 polysaccharide deacetylase [Acidovorax cavernicola]